LSQLGINSKSIVNNHKFSKMKKFFAIAIIAASLAACNNSGESKSTEDTAAAVKPDTSATMAPDTSSKMADTSKMKMAPDTSKMKADTSKKKSK